MRLRDFLGAGELDGFGGILCAGKRDVGNLCRAVEAEGKADGTDAAIDIELHVVEVEETFDVALAHGGKDERADDGESDLTAMGVTGEHEVDEGEAGVLHDVVGVVGLMAHEDDGLIDVDVGGNGQVEVGGACAGVICAADPHGVTAALDLDVAVDEDGCTVGFEGVDDVVRADGDVMVAEDGEALWGFEGGEDLCADAGGFPGGGEGFRPATDEVSGKEDEFGVEGVGLCDHLFEEPGLGVLLEVDVGDLDEAKADEGVRKIVDGKGAVGDFELMPAFGTGVGSDAEASGGCPHDEVAARDDARGEAWGAFACGG